MVREVMLPAVLRTAQVALLLLPDMCLPVMQGVFPLPFFLCAMRPSLVVLMDGQHHDIVGRQEKDGVNVALTYKPYESSYVLRAFF